LAQLAFYRPKSKELSAFPKPYPLRKRTFGGEMRVMLKTRQVMAEALAAGNLWGIVGDRVCGHQPQVADEIPIGN
jgi:hypothetical protein